MEGESQKCFIEQIVQPECSEDENLLLRSLGLDGLPSREQVHSRIEEKLLLPQAKLPDHWLPAYQLYESFSLISDCYLDYSLDIGGTAYQSHHYLRVNHHLRQRVCHLSARDLTVASRAIRKCAFWFTLSNRIFIISPD